MEPDESANLNENEEHDFAPKAPARGRRPNRPNLTPEEVEAVRAMRAETNENGGPIHSHRAIGEKFNMSANSVSAVVRNLTYHDENYVPVHDGKR